ncbi:hypothetical protein GLOIN_2v1790442 [Rhizophagus clarus]|uniref:Uncharacterized protein n=1 Tax=Rhizophagus clarus TaxID=94130 RepID=A0A8H3QCS4_9GLOM|nr:hypothetical protein GLOIN_2v1790442 [Rhizophagus clarus]
MSYHACKIYLNAQLPATLSQLDDNKTLMIVDYKIRINPKKARKTKDEWFGKHGWILHTSGDTKGHYHNTELMIILSHWKEWYDVSINRWIFLETGKVKFTIDSYHAQITHAIKRYVKLGYEIASSEDIKMAIKGLSDTHIANLQPNRDQDTDAIENLENKMNELVN